jgi:hypothetical protein
VFLFRSLLLLWSNIYTNQKLLSEHVSSTLTWAFRRALILKFRSDIWLINWVVLGRSPSLNKKSTLLFLDQPSVNRDYIYFVPFIRRSFWRTGSDIEGRLRLIELCYLFSQRHAKRSVSGVWPHKPFIQFASEALSNRFPGDFFVKKHLWNFALDLRVFVTDILSRSFSFGFMYLRGFIFLLFIDACLTDDEPLWEPIEWSLVQSWILVIFVFAWIGENLIVSRYGSYTGRDKRVWFAWYKTFWLIEGYYIFNYSVVCVFVIVPFYYETNYSLSFVYSWWHWYSRVFFFKFISVYTLLLLTAHFLQLNVRWLGWKKSLLLILIINVFLSYLLYTHFIITFFAYFTDPTWYQKSRPVDYVQLSHEPARWGWGPAKKDHFTYHNVKTVLWFKNDGPFATSFLLFQTFLFVCLFMLYIYWITLFRRVYSTCEVPLTLTTYCVSALKQFFYFFLLLYAFIFFSYISNYARFPVEFLWTLDTISWSQNFFSILSGYPQFLASIFWG